MTPMDMVREFREAAGGRANDWTKENLERRADLVSEEWAEADDELTMFTYGVDKVSKRNLAKELADLVYVVYGTAESLGIDLDRVLEEVHEANMTKFDGEVIRGENGKILKSDSYKPPVLDWIEE